MRAHRAINDTVASLSRASVAICWVILGAGCLPDDGLVSQEEYDEIRALAKAGDAEAQYQLGEFYEEGEVRRQSDATAAEWYLKAAEQGHIDAQIAVGVLYAEGLGGAEDRAEAIGWFEKAAASGDSQAQFNVGSLYTEEGEDQDFGEALKWFRAASFQGNLGALHALGIMYEQGDGVLQSDEEAHKFYKRAASEGHSGGMYGLASLLEGGRGVEQDFEEAIYWYKEAADSWEGDPQACNDLAWLYATCSFAELRDGRKAAKYALMANAENPEEFYFKDTLAAAYARSGWFEDAVAAEKRAIVLANDDEELEEAERDELIEDFRSRLRLYEEGKAYEEAEE